MINGPSATLCPHCGSQMRFRYANRSGSAELVCRNLSCGRARYATARNKRYETAEDACMAAYAAFRKEHPLPGGGA